MPRVRRSADEGNKFCANCGSPLQRAQAPPAQAQVAPVAQTPVAAPVPILTDDDGKRKGGFFASPAGIALVVILGIAVIAGIVLGVLFLIKSNANNTVDAETVKVWDEYEKILEENSESIPAITVDQNALTQTQADLKKNQDRVAALEKVLKETGGTPERRRGTTRSSSNTRDIKADQLAAALSAYNTFVQKMNELFTTLIGANLLNGNVVNKLNQILAELQKLGASVKTLSNKFLKNNEKVATFKIDPPILKFAAVAAPEVQKRVDAAMAAEQQRLAAEKAAAEAAAAAAEAERKRRAAASRPKTRRV